MSELYTVRPTDLAHIQKPPKPIAPFHWGGGKGNLARFILEHLPRKGVRIYVEPFAGAANILFRLPKPYPVEVINDLDENIVNLFRVLQDRTLFTEFAHRVVWTPYSRAEFVRALKILRRKDATQLDRAWAFFVVQNQGFGGKANTPGNWGRVLKKVARGMAGNVNDWRARMALLWWWHDRLTRVQIDRSDALECIRYWDSPETLFYLDPPYVLSTRSGGAMYSHELSLDCHRRMVEVLLDIKGMAVLSGYPHRVYRPLEEAGWLLKLKKTASHMAGRIRGSALVGPGKALRYAARVEAIYISPRARESLNL